jgi:hypothetical protein
VIAADSDADPDHHPQEAPVSAPVPAATVEAFLAHRLAYPCALYLGTTLLLLFLGLCLGQPEGRTAVGVLLAAIMRYVRGACQQVFMYMYGYIHAYDWSPPHIYIYLSTYSGVWPLHLWTAVAGLEREHGRLLLLLSDPRNASTNSNKGALQTLTGGGREGDADAATVNRTLTERA